MLTDFIVIGPAYYNYASSTVASIRRMGYSVNFFEEKPFYTNCSYMKRKLYKMGVPSVKDNWNKKWNQSLLDFIHLNAGTHTKLLFLTLGNIPDNILLQLKNYSKILILWDSIKRSSLEQQRQINLYDRVYAFEYDDLGYVKKRFQMYNISYLPVGYDRNIYSYIGGGRT